MRFALTTRWNAFRHVHGQKMIEEILSLGFSEVELGYDLRADLVPGVLEMVKNGSVTVVSVHNFCPLPVAAVRAHPEIYLFTSEDPRVRQYAVDHTQHTLRFAAEVGARAVIVHGGYVGDSSGTRELISLSEQQMRNTSEYERLLRKVLDQRDRKAAKFKGYFLACLDQLLPVLDEYNVTLAIELLPAWESVPSELEMEQLFRNAQYQLIRCWYDVGHAQVRQNLGFVNSSRWRERLEPWIVGLHIHDVQGTARDHLLPPAGSVDFSELKPFAKKGCFLVLEPAPDTPASAVTEAVAYLRGIWT